MKKYLSYCLIICSVVALASWGAVGHKTIAKIAENHLTPEVKLTPSIP